MDINNVLHSKHKPSLLVKWQVLLNVHAVIHTKDGEDIALDFRETAPGKATKDMYLDEKGNVDSNKSRLGYLSVGVPGTVAGMTEMLNKYGTKSLKELMGPSLFNWSNSNWTSRNTTF